MWLSCGERVNSKIMYLELSHGWMCSEYWVYKFGHKTLMAETIFCHVRRGMGDLGLESLISNPCNDCSKGPRPILQNIQVFQPKYLGFFCKNGLACLQEIVMAPKINHGLRLRLLTFLLGPHNTETSVFGRSPKKIAQEGQGSGRPIQFPGHFFHWDF